MSDPRTFGMFRVIPSSFSVALKPAFGLFLMTFHECSSKGKDWGMF